MRLSKSWIILIFIVLISLFILLDNGSRNIPFESESEYSEVSLTEDPEVPPPLFNFDFLIPLFDIPLVNDLLGLGSTGLLLITFVLIFMILIFMISFLISYRQRSKKGDIEEQGTPIKEKEIEIKIRRTTLGKRIQKIIQFLFTCLETNRYDEGITIGFERLDEAMKEYSKIKRPAWLTPREFTQLKIPYFDHDELSFAVEQFYKITYGQKEATKRELEIYIERFQKMISDRTALTWKSDVLAKEDQND